MEELKTENIKLPLLVYDDQCSLCLRFKTALDRLPGTDVICKISVHDQRVYDLYPELNKEECLKEVHLIDQNHKILKGVEVITFLLEQFPGVEKFAWLLESNMGQKALGFFNKIIESYREELQKDCPSCNKHG